MNMATEDTTDEATAVSRDLHEVLDELDAQNPMSDIGRALLVRRVGGDAPIDDTTPPRAISLVVLYSDGVSDARLEIGPANRPSESAQRIGPANRPSESAQRIRRHLACTASTSSSQVSTG